MTEREGEAERARVTGLAASLARPEVVTALRAAQRAGALDLPPPDAAGGAPQAHGLRSISIWQPRRRASGLELVRPPRGPFGDHYADRPSITVSKAPASRRICLLGESAAAGYLYAPAITPAKLLGRQLAMLGAENVDVVDLARTNERLATLIETAERALQLDPDAIVVFAGNNWTLLETPEWSAHAPSLRTRLAFGEALEADGLWGPIQAAARAVLERAAAALARLARLAQQAAVPVILVVPEVNLEAWSNRQPVPWLAAGGIRRWHTAYARGRAALLAGDAAAARAAARRMLELDDGLCPTGFRLLGHAAQLDGETAAAIAAYRDEVAASHHASLAFLSAPQASPMGQAVLRRAAAHHGFTLVDLPQRFRCATGSPLPGERLFLDYCHLSAEGMWLAMAAVAGRLGACLGLDQPADDDAVLARLGPLKVAADTEALARFGAAIHCAHRLVSVLPRQPLLERHCRAALDASPAIAEAMIAFVEARTSGLPAVLSAGQRRLDEAGWAVGFQHGWRWDNLDAAVIRALLASLETSDQAAHREARSILCRAGLDHTGPVSLLDAGRYLAAPLERFFPELLRDDQRPGHGLYRAPWPETRFVLPLGAPCGLELEITARLARQNGLPAAAEGILGVVAGGRTLARLRLGPIFSRQRVLVPASALTAGLNEVRLVWPPPTVDGEAALAAAVARLARGIEADLHPVWGELFAVTCRPLA